MNVKKAEAYFHLEALSGNLLAVLLGLDPSRDSPSSG